MEFNRFDVATKELVWEDPAECLERFGIGPPGPVDVIDSDITVLTASADKVIRVGGPRPYRYNYRVVRLWEESPDSYLTAGVNLVPLVPLTNVTVDQLPGVVRQIERRINAEPAPGP